MRSLGKIRQIVEEATGLEITHFHDDLVFIEHSVMLIRFDDSNFSNFFWYTKAECIAENRQHLLTAFIKAAIANGMHCIDGGSFSMTEIADKEELLIEFS